MKLIRIVIAVIAVLFSTHITSQELPNSIELSNMVYVWDDSIQTYNLKYNQPIHTEFSKDTLRVVTMPYINSYVCELQGEDPIMPYMNAFTCESLKDSTYVVYLSAPKSGFIRGMLYMNWSERQQTYSTKIVFLDPKTVDPKTNEDDY